jgi:hypothetical protein
MTAFDVILATCISWAAIIAFVTYRLTSKRMNTYTEEDMAAAYKKGFEASNNHMLILVTLICKTIDIGIRMRKWCVDEIACEEFDKLAKDIEQATSPK